MNDANEDQEEKSSDDGSRTDTESDLKTETLTYTTTNESNTDNENEIIFDIFKKMIEYMKVYLPTQATEDIPISLLSHDIHNFELLLKIIYYDYVIFLPNNFFIRTYNLFNNKHKFLLYLEKYNILYFDWEDKHHIKQIINFYNLFIKNSKETHQRNLIRKFWIPNTPVLNKIFFNNKSNILTRMIGQTKLKEIYFQDSVIEPNILYKKIVFSNQELFLNFHQYSMKKVEYKLRSFCQIAEELGSQKIDIKYVYKNDKKNMIESIINVDKLKLGASTNSQTENDWGMSFSFGYPSNHIHINLNKYHLINKILKENQFLISKEEFDSDVELKYLIDARCTNFIQKYNTQFMVENCNFIEKKIFAKAKQFGIEFDSSYSENLSIHLSIFVEFFSLFEHPHIIDGTNIHVLREGFLFLIRLINENKSLSDKKNTLLINFLKSHFFAIENQWINLPYDYLFLNNTLKIYKQIIEHNFKHDEFDKYIELYFQKNNSWSSFIQLRDTLLLGNSDSLDKLSFITNQYYDILNFKKTLFDNLLHFLDDPGLTQINNYFINHLKNTQLYFDFVLDLTSDFKLKIKNIVLKIFKKSFRIESGISDFQDIISLKEILCHLMIYNFDSDIYDLHLYLENIKKKYNLKTTIISFPRLKQYINNILNDSVDHLFQNGFLNKHDDSPINLNDLSLSLSPNSSSSQNTNTEKKLNTNKNIIEKQKLFFIKFIIKYYQLNNKFDNLRTYLNYQNNLESQSDIENDLDTKIDLIFTKTHILQNYSINRLFYTFDDFLYFQQLIKSFKPPKVILNNESNIKKEFINLDKMHLHHPFYYTPFHFICKRLKIIK